MASQVLGAGEAEPGNHVAQDGPAKIVPGGGRDAGMIHALLQNAVQRFRGEILIQPSQVPAIGNEAEKCPGRLAPDRQPILEVAGGIAHQPGRDRALFVALPDNAHKVPGRGSIHRGDILHGQASYLMDARAELPGQGDHSPIPDTGFAVVLEALFHKLVELGNWDIPAGFNADGTAAARGLGDQAALGGLDDGLAFFGRQQAAQGGIVQGAGRGCG